LSAASIMPATMLARSSLWKLARAMRTARRFDGNLHRACRATFHVGRFFGWMSELIDYANQKKNCGRDNEKANQERNEVAVIPSDRSGLRGVCRSMECGRAVLCGSQNEELV